MEGRKDGRTQNAIEKQLAKITDPDTGIDVMRLGLIRDLNVARGEVSLTYRPPLPHSPAAVVLGSRIRDAVRGVPGVRRLRIHVEDSDRAREIERLLEA